MSDPQPYYARHVFCCTNRRVKGYRRGCSAEKDSVELRNYLKRRAKEEGLADVRINVSGCLDRCELGPTLVIYPEGVWYGYANREDLDEILERHLKQGERVARLMLHPEQRPPDKKAEAG